MPSLGRLAREASGKGIQVLAISVGEARSQVAEFVKAEKIEAVILMDPTADAFRKYGLRGHPAVVLIDAEGRKRWVSYSFDDALKLWDEAGKDPGRFLR
ncbi:MAG: TlpA family protein disulfide reductase [Candidatus Tectomicrobia bacterium]|uniref:TlpA family protein disulfide reductase n=1 Tax=Tectimicrobiota bacterium TaxID=2528274 RepID=A0A932MPZ8_UNCTE|nr:TlpA family protein disulfide reductase [Candidatus Tectomicrobia bacterium]